MKFSANCPLAEYPTHDSFSLSPLAFFQPPYPASSYYFRQRSPDCYSHFHDRPPHGLRPGLLVTSRGIISENICGIDFGRIISRNVWHRRIRAIHISCGKSIYIVHYVYSRLRESELPGLFEKRELSLLHLISLPALPQVWLCYWLTFH